MAEALDVPGCVVEVFACEPPDHAAQAAHPDQAARAGRDEHADLRARVLDQGLHWHQVDDRALTSLTDTVHPQGLVAVCRFVDRPLTDLLTTLERPRLVAMCADVRDPGNAGTVIRCADAAGAEAVVLTGHSVDPYNGKTVRATVGSLFHLPLALEADPAAAVAAVQAKGLVVLAADGSGELDLDDAADRGLLAGPTAWLFGNEAWGLPAELATLADHRVRIPIHGRAESLNLATAAAVCLYASARAQRAGGGERAGGGQRAGGGAGPTLPS